MQAGLHYKSNHWNAFKLNRKAISQVWLQHNVVHWIKTTKQTYTFLQTEVIWLNKVIQYEFLHTYSHGKNKQIKIHHCSVNNRNIWSPIVAINPSITFLFSFFKMYIQNAAQWYNLNQYHVNKFLIRINKQTNKKSSFKALFTYTKLWNQGNSNRF